VLCAKEEHDQKQNQNRKCNKDGTEFCFAQIHKHIEGGGQNGNGETVTEEHCSGGQPSAHGGIDHSLAFLCGEAGVGKQRNHLESGAFLSHTRKPEEDGNDIGDDDVEYDQQNEHDQSTNQEYHAPSKDIFYVYHSYGNLTSIEEPV
jgi:hypothetical protein